MQALRERGPGRLLIEASESKRIDARAETIGLVLRSIVVAVIWTFAAMMILGELDINLGPLVAGAGIGGIALGFGAQSIVKDFLSGLFMLIEDQYGVGDYIDVGVASGTVEAVSLRSTTLRDTFRDRLARPEWRDRPCRQHVPALVACRHRRRGFL